MAAVQTLDGVALEIGARREELAAMATARILEVAPAYVRSVAGAGDDLSQLVGATTGILAASLSRPDLLDNLDSAIEAYAMRRSSLGLPLDRLLEVISIQRGVVAEELERLAGPGAEEVLLLGERHLQAAYTRLVMGITAGYLDGIRVKDQEHRDALEDLVQISRAVNQAVDVPDVAQAGLRETARALVVDAAALHLPGPNGLAAAYTTGPEQVEPALIEAAADSPGPVQAAGSVAVALRFHGDLIGVMALKGRLNRRFQPAELTFLLAVADHLAVALARALQHRLEARTDHLTGLANRPEFDRAMERAMASAARHGRPFVLAVLDLDRLKEINDGWGHHAGDRALRTVADVLGRVVRASDTCARLGGDEFAIAMPDTDLRQAEEVVRRVRGALRDRAGRFPFPLEVSIGVASWEKGMTAARLFRDADARLYQEKRRHRSARAAS